MKLTGAQVVWETIIQQGTTTVFGYPGGAILPVYDALVDYRDRVHHVLVRHEENAALAADAYFRATGKVGQRDDGFLRRRRHHRPGGVLSGRLGRLPRDRRDRRDAADHQA
jgi:hypothetical protein